MVAHVGDSRCYLLRDGELMRLTHDHSLVGELVARGKLTEEQAESHPQRSVITRALGPEPTVEVDVDAFPARAGDVFLLCSDGLTSMVHEPKLKPLLEDPGSRSSRSAGALIAAANEAGGRDNITVILFRLEDVDDRRDDAARRAGDDRVRRAPGGLRDLRRRGARAAPGPHEADRASQAVPDADEAEYRRHGTVALQALRPGDARLEEGGAAAPAREPPPRTVPLPDDVPPSERRPAEAAAPQALRRVPAPRPRSSSSRSLVGAWLASRTVFFIGTDPADGRTVTIFRGLPYELPFGIDLYERYYRSGVTLADVPPARRARFTDHEWRTRDDAEDLVIALEKGQLE